MAQCPYCKKPFEYQEIVIEGANLPFHPRCEKYDYKLHNILYEAIVSRHYFFSCPHCQSFLGVSRK